MRIRSIKPEFWTSTSISALPIEDRLLFIGLWSYVDDNGVGLDRLALVAADLFPDDIERDPRETFARVSRGLASLSEAGRIIRYTVAGVDYLHVTNWSEHQRIDKPAKGRYPLPTTGNALIRETLATPSRDLRDTLAPGTGEQGNRGTGEQTLSPAADAPSKSERIDADFAEWYATYPRKTARGRALTAYRTARKKTDAETLLAAVAAQTRLLTAKGPEFTPHPATWLNGERWLDEAPTSQPAWDDEDDWVEPVEDRSAYEAYDAQMRALEEAQQR